MLKSLVYTVEFPSTGRSFRNRLTFSPGLTAIVGRNEAGKSLIVEMITYALFGKAALRGLASDYKNLSVGLELEITGRKVQIIRDKGQETLFVNGDVTAVGAEALNRTIPELLGFQRDVFTVALVALQDELNEFTKMKPTARAKMVDDLTGLNALQVTEKECKDSAKNHKAVADTLRIALSEPQPPTEPEGYAPANAVEKDLTGVVARQVIRDGLAKLQAPVAPVEPEKPDVDATADELYEYENARKRIEQHKQWLEQQLTRIPEPRSSLEEVELQEAYDEYVRDTSTRGPRPTKELATLLEYEKLWMQPHEGKCPQCGYSFTDHRAPMSLGEVREQLVRHERWKDAPSPKRSLGINAQQERAAHERASEREAIRSELLSITVPVSRSRDLQRVGDYNVEYLRYDERRKRYEADLRTWEEAQEALQALPDETARLEELKDRLYQARSYERDLAVYTQRLTDYEAGMVQVEQARENADGFLRGAQALKLTREKGKQELAPSLSKAASVLLYSLTAGERQTVVVDEDFNVWVDGQPLSTLSGSGKAVVNLALRIGLGQVLTAKILSLFIGDEIDGSMDQTRAEATHTTFRNLTQHIDQVILITHKEIEADHVISL